MDLAALVDRERYLLASRSEARIAEFRQSLRETGCVTVPGFVRPEVLADMRAEAQAAYHRAHRREALLTAYSAGEATGDERHPTRRTSLYRMSAAAADCFAPERALLQLYTDQTFIRFVADILGEPELFPLGDPLLRLAVSFLVDGDEHGWHFDGNDFVVSLLLQAGREGGEFEYAPFLRSADAPNFDAVARVMDGEPGALRRVRVEPGTLSIFCGKRALHRVTTVRGDIPRMMALFSYDRVPQLVHEAHVQLRAFGRTLQPA